MVKIVAFLQNYKIHFGTSCYTQDVTNITNTKIVGPAQVWDPTSTNKTISIKATTWKRLQKYGNHFGSTYDSIITQILDENEGKSTPENGRSF